MSAPSPRKDSAAPVAPGETLPLLTHTEAETWLANRLLQHGCDIYVGGPYATYADRLGACIVRNRMQCVVVGRNPATRKPESYRQLFERIAGKKLPKTVDDVLRGTQTNVTSQPLDITP